MAVTKTQKRKKIDQSPEDGNILKDGRPEDKIKTLKNENGRKKTFFGF